MAKTPFKVEVLTPEGEAFNDEVVMVSTKTGVGSIGLLANHQPLLAQLDPTELRLYRSESEIVSYAQGEGYLQVQSTPGEDSKILVLVDEIHEVGKLDERELGEKLKRAEGELESAEHGSAEQRAARRAVQRYEAWLSIARGGSE